MQWYSIMVVKRLIYLSLCILFSLIYFKNFTQFAFYLNKRGRSYYPPIRHTAPARRNISTGFNPVYFYQRFDIMLGSSIIIFYEWFRFRFLWLLLLAKIYYSSLMDDLWHALVAVMFILCYFLPFMLFIKAFPLLFKLIRT